MKKSKADWAEERWEMVRLLAAYLINIVLDFFRAIDYIFLVSRPKKGFYEC